jgi:hypothetical protein
MGNFARLEARWPRSCRKPPDFSGSSESTIRKALPRFSGRFLLINRGLRLRHARLPAIRLFVLTKPNLIFTGCRYAGSNLQAGPGRYGSFLGCDTMSRRVIPDVISTAEARITNQGVFSKLPCACLCGSRPSTTTTPSNRPDFGYLWRFRFPGHRTCRHPRSSTYLRSGSIGNELSSFWVSNLYPISNNRRADAAWSTNTPKRHEPDVDAALWKSSNPLPLRALALQSGTDRAAVRGSGKHTGRSG